MRQRIFVFTILLLSLAAISEASPQRRNRHGSRRAEVSWLKKYTDSLMTFRDSLYSDSVSASQLKAIDLAPLFLPLTYYSKVSHDAFSLDTELTSVERSMLGVYLSHPELVENTQRHLDNTGSIPALATVTESPVNVVTKANPEEPEPLPLDIVVLKPNFWKLGGDYYLQFLQNYISDNWYQGGESNYSMVGAVTLTANYNNKQKLKWDNMLEMKLGLQTTRSDTVHRTRATEDLLRYTGKLMLQASKKWYYAVQVLAQTQFARHYNANNPEIQSDFASPFNLNVSAGMDYDVSWLKGAIMGSVHLAPFAYNLKYVGRRSLSERNGLEDGHHSLNDIGSQITASLLWKFTDNISWNSRLYWYTTYKRTEAEWENTFSFQFNRFLATKIFLYPRFDDGLGRDDRHGYWMFKEYVSLGFSYAM